MSCHLLSLLPASLCRSAFTVVWGPPTCLALQRRRVRPRVTVELVSKALNMAIDMIPLYALNMAMDMNPPYVIHQGCFSRSLVMNYPKHLRMERWNANRVLMYTVFTQGTCVHTGYLRLYTVFTQVVLRGKFLLVCIYCALLTSPLEVAGTN